MFTHLLVVSVTRETPSLLRGANDRGSGVNHGQTCEKGRRRRWDIEHLQALGWFSRLTVAGELERRRPDCYLSKQHSQHCSLSPLALPRSCQEPSALLICRYLCPSHSDSRPHDDVNARRRNDESRRLRSRIACGGNGSGLRYLPNRMKKRTHQAPHQGNEGTSQDRSPPSGRSRLFVPFLLHHSSPSPPSHLYPGCLWKAAEPLIQTKKVVVRCSIMHQINIGALQIIHA